MKEVCFVLLVELSFEGSRVERRPLAIIFIIDVHDKLLVAGALLSRPTQSEGMFTSNTQQ